MSVSTSRVESYIHELRSHKAIVPCNQHMKTFVVQEISELSNLCTLKVGGQFNLFNVLVDNSICISVIVATLIPNCWTYSKVDWRKCNLGVLVLM